MTTYLFLALAAVAGLSVLLSLAWWVQKRSGQSGWVDMTWTYGLGAAGVFFALWPVGSVTSRQILVAVLAAAWALRLGTHMAQRTARGGDDPRYAKLKQDWGDRAQSKMFWFLQVQALAAWFLALGILAAARAPRPGLDWRDALGALTLLVSVIGETLSDRELKRFGRDPANKGKICDVGLWAWSRHPNYFFDWFGWLAYPVIAISGGYPWGWVALVCPVYIYYLLVYVSGIPPLEDHLMLTRPEAFGAYKARTPAFFPLPLKRP